MAAGNCKVSVFFSENFQQKLINLSESDPRTSVNSEKKRQMFRRSLKECSKKFNFRNLFKILHKMAKFRMSAFKLRKYAEFLKLPDNFCVENLENEKCLR